MFLQLTRGDVILFEVSTIASCDQFKFTDHHSYLISIENFGIKVTGSTEDIRPPI